MTTNKRNYTELVNNLRNGIYSPLLTAAANAIEELQAEVFSLQCHYCFGYDIHELLLFARACRENDVDEHDLKTFSRNVEAAFRIVADENERVIKETLERLMGIDSVPPMEVVEP